MPPRQERDHLKCFYLHQPVYNSCSFSTEQDLKGRETKRPSSECWLLPCQISCLCTEPVSVPLVASLGFWSESLRTVCCLKKPAEIILGEGYFCKPEHIDWKVFHSLAIGAIGCTLSLLNIHWETEDGIWGLHPHFFASYSSIYHTQGHCLVSMQRLLKWINAVIIKWKLLPVLPN